ncbi:MAG: LytTR family DNA-binding domain-containing protein [Candidatus Omnitrophota bacterium]|jgi:DNA-binding LytR/AlgR family response regulator
MIRTFVVDDEMPARNELKRFLKIEPDFAVIGEASDGEMALRDIKRLRPQVVFMDIHMPKMNGLEVASGLAGSEAPPLVVFVTAYDEHALEAFEVNAIDYVLKPFDRERFKKSCAKVRQTLNEPKDVKKKLVELNHYLSRHKFPNLVGWKRGNKDRVFIHPQDVRYFHAKLTEVTAHLKDGTELVVGATLKVIQQTLEPAQFEQTHRAFVVNLEQVEKVSPAFSGNFEMTLQGPDKMKIPLSRRYARKIRKILNW